MVLISSPTRSLSLPGDVGDIFVISIWAEFSAVPKPKPKLSFSDSRVMSTDIASGTPRGTITCAPTLSVRFSTVFATPGAAVVMLARRSCFMVAAVPSFGMFRLTTRVIDKASESSLIVSL